MYSFQSYLEKEMATHSSILAWKIPWTEEPGRLRSMGSQRVGHDRAISHSFIHLICSQERMFLAFQSEDKHFPWRLTRTQNRIK